MSSTSADKSGTPDPWSRMVSLVTALTPILVLLVGYVLNQKVNEANRSLASQRALVDELKIRAEELKIKVDAESIATKSQIEKVDAVLKLLQDLTGTNPERRRVAMEAVKIVLPPKEAIAILTALKDSAEPGSKQAAEVKSVLSAERDRLLEGMFSFDKDARTAALRALQQAWSGDETMVRQVLARARPVLDERQKKGFPQKPLAETSDEYQRRAVVYNVMAFLSGVTTPDPALRQEVVEFAAAAEKNSADTAALSERLLAKFRR